jgi:hypothetical protein
MEASDQADDFIPAGFASLGLEADEIELAVIGAVHAMFWPPILDLFELDTSTATPEARPDLSQPPPSR